jgi:hypothetical protein
MAERVKMTEGEYKHCLDPSRLLQFLRSRYAYPAEKASNRKLRLFACACCRRIWHLLTDDRSRRAVELSEMYADGFVTQEEVEAAGKAVVGAYSIYTNSCIGYAVAGAAFGSFNSREAIGILERSAQADEGVVHSSLLRDIYGNPFHPATVAESWLIWSDCTVVKLAQGIYEDRAFDRLPVLADALEEAGCTDQTILEHCRIPGLHVRGCWAVDLLLGNTPKAGSWIHRLRDSTSG